MHVVQNELSRAVSVFELPTATQMRTLLRMGLRFSAPVDGDASVEVLRELNKLTGAHAAALFDATQTRTARATLRHAAWPERGPTKVDHAKFENPQSVIAFTSVLRQRLRPRQVIALRRPLGAAMGDAGLIGGGLSHAACSIAADDKGGLTVLLLYRGGGVPFTPRAVACLRLLHSVVDFFPARGAVAGPELSDDDPLPLVAHNDKPFTRREKVVLVQLLGGGSEKQVARHLKRSTHTIHTYVKRLYRRFGVTSRGELLARFVSADAAGRAADVKPASGDETT